MKSFIWAAVILLACGGLSIFYFHTESLYLIIGALVYCLGLILRIIQVIRDNTSLVPDVIIAIGGFIPLVAGAIQMWEAVK